MGLCWFLNQENVLSFWIFFHNFFIIIPGLIILYLTSKLCLIHTEVVFLIICIRFYRVFDDRGKQYCDCSHEEYAIRTVELHEKYQNEKFTYRRIDSPKPLPPHIVDVTAEYEGQLPGQRGLSKAKERLPFEPEIEELPQSNSQKI